MPVTIGQTAADTSPRRRYAPYVELRQLWEDPWVPDPSIGVVRCITEAAGQGIGQAELIRRYGAAVHDPHQSALEARTPIDRSGWWVRIMLAGESGTAQIWIGKIATERRDIQGSGAAATGIQAWIAYEPAYVLQKVHIARSIWLVGGVEKTIGWLPSINARGEGAWFTGNRSAAMSGLSYVYGGTERWTWLQYIEYLLARFIDENEYDGPPWSVAGQTAPVAAMEGTIGFGDVATVYDMIRELIPRWLGLDFKINYTGLGFEIEVFALSDREYTFGGATLPRNPNTTTIEPESFTEAPHITIVRSLENQYDRIRLIGRRIVVCCTLDPMVSYELKQKWTDALRAAYWAGTGTPGDDAAKHDLARTAERLAPVFQLFGADVDWHLKYGLAAPLLDAEGHRIDGSADFQTRVRSTLSWSPLQMAYKYEGESILNENPAEHDADFLPGAVWVYDTELARWIAAEAAGIAVFVARNDWGVMLSATPNHLMALGDWAVGAAPTAVEPKYNWLQGMLATIAFETDQRLELRHELTSGESPNGETLTVEEPDGQVWIVVQGTVIGVKEDGTLRRTTREIILRNDAGRLAIKMAGLIARYYAERVRCDITVKGLGHYSELVGQVLTVVEAGLDTQFVGAAITSVEYVTGLLGGEQQTIVRAGYAR